jgi:hypothetical protein
MALTCDASGDVYMTGYFGSPTAIFNQTILSNPGMYLAKIDNTTGIYNPASQKYEVLIYPNPNKGTFTISYNSQLSILNSQFIITDVMGNEVYNQPINNSTQSTINISNLSNGVYFYQIRNEKETMRGKFVVEK